MRFANRAVCAGGLIFAACFVAACGASGSLLSKTQSTELKNQLAQVTNSLNARQCQQAANEIQTFQSTVQGLNSVDSSLVSNLNQGAQTIAQLASRQCPTTTQTTSTNAKTTATSPTTATTTSTPSTTTPATTSTTPTTPTTPITTPTTPTTPTGPGSGGAGLGGGNGNGNGNGNGD